MKNTKTNKLAIIVTIFCALLLAACSSSSKQQKAPMKLFPFSNGEKFGYADMEGKVVVQPQFEHAYMFRDGIALVRVGAGEKPARYGYVKEDGTMLTEPIYVEATQFNEGLAWVVKEDGCPMAIDTKGKVQIEAKEAHYVRCFSEGLAAFSVEEKPHQYLWGFMNTSGKVVIKPQFKEVGDFFEGLAAVKTDFGWDYIDTKGKVVLRNIPNRYPNVHNDRILKEDEEMGLVGLYDKKGKQVVPCEYTVIIPDGDLFYFNDDEQNHGWMDKNGKVVLTVDPDMLMKPFGGTELAAFQKDNKWGYINRKGKIVITVQFDDAFPFSGGHAVVKKDNHIGIINEKGEFVVNPTFDHATRYHSAMEDYDAVIEDYPSESSYVETRYIDPELLANTQITNKGVGPIKIDMKLSDIPKSVNYLYDSLVVERYDGDAEILADISFYLKGRLIFGARSWDGKVIGSIGVGFDQRSRVVNPIYFQADDRRCRIQDTFKQYITDHNLKKTTVESCGGPVSYYDLQGLKVYTNWLNSIEQFEIGEYVLLWD